MGDDFLRNTFNHKTLFLCILLFVSTTSEGANYCKMTDQIVKNYIKEYAIPRGLCADGYGGSFMHNVHVISLDFVSNQALSVAEARILYIEMMEEFLHRINMNSKIRPYLHNYPFDHKNFELNISFRNKNKRVLQPECVAFMFYIDRKNTLYYDAYDPQQREFYSIHTESYEEALEIVKSQTSATCLEIPKPQSHSKAKRKNNKKH